jgi:hypothetical protein
MPQRMEIKQFVRSLFVLIDDRAWDRLGDFFAVHGTYERPGFPPLVGLARIVEFYRHERSIEAGVHTVAEVLCDGDGVACWGEMTGTLRDGSQVQVRFADVFHLADGRIGSRTSYFFAPLV